jgi:hypothetical protein
MSPVGLGTKNDCTAEGQQQFTQLTVKSVLICIVSTCYLATISEQTEDFMCALAVAIYSVLISETVPVICS